MGDSTDSSGIARTLPESIRRINPLRALASAFRLPADAALINSGCRACASYFNRAHIRRAGGHRRFSIGWKRAEKFLHSMEFFGKFFPSHGNMISEQARGAAR
jgi:hypothetical protein